MFILRHFDACEEKQQIKTKHTNSININLLMHLNLVIQYFDIDKWGFVLHVFIFF